MFLQAEAGEETRGKPDATHIARFCMRMCGVPGWRSSQRSNFASAALNASRWRISS